MSNAFAQPTRCCLCISDCTTPHYLRIVPLFPLAPATAAAPPPTFSLNYAALHTPRELTALEQPTRSSACCSDHTSPSRLLRLPRRVCFTCLYVTTAAAPPAPAPLRRPRCARRESSNHPARCPEHAPPFRRAPIAPVILEPVHSIFHAKGKCTAPTFSSGQG